MNPQKRQKHKDKSKKTNTTEKGKTSFPVQGEKTPLYPQKKKDKRPLAGKANGLRRKQKRIEKAEKNKYNRGEKRPSV